MFGSAFLVGALVFSENHDMKEAVVFGSAFLAGAFVLKETHAQEKKMSLGSAFLAGALVFQGKKHAQEKSYVPPIGVPSRGFCFLENMSRKKLCLSGRRS